VCLAILSIAAASLVMAAPAAAAISSTTISTATNPLAVDIDSAGNTWIGYAEGPGPKGVTVVPAATGSFFGVSATAGVETLIFALDSVQGILRTSPSGHLFVSTGSGALYVATAVDDTVFGVFVPANTLTQLSGSAPAPIRAGHFDGGLAMDSAGNLFGGRKAAGGVAVLPVASGMLFGVNVVANTSTVLVPTLEWTGDVAVDSSDNLYSGSWFGGSQGVHVLPKANGTLYGVPVTQDTLTRLAAVSFVSGIDIDGQDNIYFAQWAIGQINVLSPVTRTLFGQEFTANVSAVLVGSSGRADQGLAVNSAGTILVSGARSSTVRIVGVSAPTIVSVSPSSGPPSGGGTVTITGTDLTGTTNVTFGGVAAANITVVDASTVTATVPAGSPGSVDVSVTTPGGTATAVAAFSYVNLPPRIPPGPPLNVRAESVVLGAQVSWEPPSDPGTDALTLYAVRSWPGGQVCQVSATIRSCEATGLDPEIDYYFTVVPMSGAGWGTPSAPSNTVKPLAPKAPGAPAAVVAFGGDEQATVSWEAPVDPGTSPISEYRVTASPGGVVCIVASPPCLMTGLINGTAYTFVVEAQNAQGWGPASNPSAVVTPQPPSVSITGARAGRVVSLDGRSVSVTPGSTVQVWMRIGDDTDFTQGLAVVTVGSDGTFTWERRLNPAKPIVLYVVADQVRSNTAVLRVKGPVSP